MNVEIYIDKQLADTFQEGLGLRLNLVLNDPEKLTYTQAEYSFTFDLPATKDNIKLFNFANVISKRNKFTKKYVCDIYADETPIFNGYLRVTSFEDDTFKCIAYQPKINNINEIFGETKMNEMTWEIPFNGIPTINELNADPSSKVFFPLIAYSLFQKIPNETYGSGYQKYTDKYTIDDTNRFYFNSFIPSVNMVALLKQMCESKGYTLQGDIITDKVLNEIYLTNYISENQKPLYNYGNDKMGKTRLYINFKNYTTKGQYTTYPQIYTSYEQEYIPTIPAYENHNLSTVYNLLDTSMNTSATTFLSVTETYKNNANMYVNGGIQIPTDGWYEINCDVNLFVPKQEIPNVLFKKDISGNTEARTLTFTMENYPIEFQLLKYDADDSQENNINHNMAYFGEYPNENSASTANRTTGSVGRGEYSPTAAKTPAYTNMPSSGDRFTSYATSTAVDPYNNPDFICGLQATQYAIGKTFRKNGNSWSPEIQEKTRNKYLMKNTYYKKKSPAYEQVQVNENDYTNGGGTITFNSGDTGHTTSGQIRCCIYLTKNTMLIPYLNIREYQKQGTTTNYRDTYLAYNCEAKIDLQVRAIGDYMLPEKNISYGMSSKFDTNLNLANFLNDSQKMSDFISDVQKAFNLQLLSGENTITMNKTITSSTSKPHSPIDLDKITNEQSIISNSIDYPKSIQVKFKPTDDEETTYRSAEANATEEQFQSNNWLDYADKGYDVIPISTLDDAEAIEQSLNFAYTGFLPFKYNDTTLNIPVIAKTEWFIEDAFNYGEYQQYDGRSFPQRFITRNEPSSYTLPVVNNDDYVITLPSSKTTNNINLDYKKTNSLLSYFFDIKRNPLNDEIEVEAYITPLQYKQIKQGASVKLDDNIYKVNQIEGFDPSQTNLTKLKLMPF